MATLFHLATYSSLSSRKLFLFHQQHRSIAQDSSPKDRFSVCFASAKKSSRKTKSNVELYNDLKEFLSSAGFPEDHVPLMKELLQHGRNDLAYIVRRRGYKNIRELLATANRPDEEQNIAVETEATAAKGEKSEGQNESAGNMNEETSLSSGAFVGETSSERFDIDSSRDFSGSNQMHIESLVSHSVEDKTLQDEVQSVPLSMETPMAEEIVGSMNRDMELKLSSDTSLPDETATTLASEDEASHTSSGQLEVVGCPGEEIASTNIEDRSHTCGEPRANQSQEERLAKFMQDGYLDPVEDDLYAIPGKAEEESKNFINQEITRSGNFTEIHQETPTVEHSDHAHGLTNGVVTQNNSQTIQSVSPAKAHLPLRGKNSTAEEPFDGNADNNMDEETGRRENQAEINNLKFMLHQKELELSQLKEQIEKEKLALAMLQTKVQNEINKAHKIISERDVELQAAEENLSGLKEVQIDYSGNGDIVEVAGSFNGWHHRIKMDLQPLATVADSTGSRRAKLWSTMLWLYPGTYEIKFIVDGEWRLDPQKESVNRGAMCNNVLHVDR